MQAYVLTDKSLERQAGRFVWLSINTENAKNADFLGKYRISALPTMFVLDRTGQNVMLRHVGSATVPQLGKMLDDVRRSGGDAEAALAAADKLAAQGNQEDAAKLYASALDKAPKGWSKRGRTAEALILALATSGQDEACATRARDLYSSMKGTVSGANVAVTGLGCAAELDEKNPKRAALIAALEPPSREALANAKLALTADDRSGIYLTLASAREAAGDKDGARKLTEEMVADLEKAAREAKTPQQRAVYDSFRLSAYIELGTPEKAIPMLEQSQRDFPDDYNPPSRLAVAYRAMKKYDEALTASDRALALVYGPRKITVLRARADILTAKGDKEGARQAIADAISFAKSLPSGQRNDRTIAALEKRLADMTK
jgi:thioredoxin-like negative regulator of GroEL